MKKLLILLFYGIFCCLTVFSQETAIFQIRKIKKIENGCYKLTAKKNGEKYTIFTHYDDEEKNYGEKIQLYEYLELTINPFFETEHMTLAEFKKGVGLQVNSEDSTRFVDVTLPFNYQFININYYGNILKVKKKMLYYTSDINGLYKKKCITETGK
jgi:hypothetical protein